MMQTPGILLTLEKTPFVGPLLQSWILGLRGLGPAWPALGADVLWTRPAARGQAKGHLAPGRGHRDGWCKSQSGRGEASKTWQWGLGGRPAQKLSSRRKMGCCEPRECLLKPPFGVC